MTEWKECKLGDILSYISNGIVPVYANEVSPNTVRVLNQKCNRDFKIDYSYSRLNDISNRIIPDERYLQEEDVLINSTGKGTAGRVAQIFNIKEKTTIDGHLILLRPKPIVNKKYFGYFLKAHQKTIESFAEGSTGQTEINKSRLCNEITIPVPPLPTQKKIADILSSIDEMIELNNRINDNLEQQAQAIFKNIFADNIKNVSDKNGKPLSELIDIIDNRGKTPPTSPEKNDYPIIDINTLKSTGRIIDYRNCTRYVSEQTYSTFFKAGHPIENDILLSTVGNLAQMKLFKGHKGCIAQNVVAFRSLDISPFYLYEYLKFIKNDLLGYDIGSALPSIKVSHIIKHLIYIPTNNELSKFDPFAKSITEQIYNNVCENERLISLRDALLPKLMNGMLL